jgi:hypothetical protein
MTLFAVIKYFNYRKEMFMEIINIYDNFESADKKAKYYAKRYSQQYNTADDKVEVVNKVDDDYLDMKQAIVKYTIFDGFDHMVYGVVELPEKEVEDIHDNEINVEQDN